MIGYKILTPGLRSMTSERGVVEYGPEWVEVPGNGAYLGLTLSGLLRGEFREPAVLAEMEYEEPTGIVSDCDVVTARRVRVLRSAPIDRWHLVRVAIYAARLVAHPSADPRVEAAIVAAERCERDRTPAAYAAVGVAWAATTEAEAWSAVRKAAWAAAWAAAEAAAEAAAAAAADADAAVAWADAAAAAGGRKEIHANILASLVADVWPGAVVNA